MEGKTLPDYSRAIAIVTEAAQKELVIPAAIVVISPVLAGLLGAEALGGFLGGVVIVGLMLAFFMCNTGGAWDNAKKYVEDGHFGGKGSDTHKAAVVGDTVGDHTWELLFLSFFLSGLSEKINKPNLQLQLTKRMAFPHFHTHEHWKNCSV